MEARFEDVEWSSNTLSFSARVGDLSGDLWVELPSGTERPPDDLIAIFFATLAGPNLSSMEMQLCVSPKIANTIENFAGCELRAERREEDFNWRKPLDGHAVSFSGGFDSLAAMVLLPGKSQLISMDFGGAFQRETDFFVRFSPNIVRTNFRRAGFGRRSWMFMLAGVILLKDQMNLGQFTTGSILESSPWNYAMNIEGMPSPPPLLQAIGLRQINTTLGITEVATTLLAMKHFPEHVAGSLKSLAAPDTGKSRRKHMLVRSLSSAGRASVDTAPALKELSEPPLTWGQSLTDDMLAAYMLKRAGEKDTRGLMKGIPEAVFEIAEKCNLSFYERYHTGLYYNMDEQIMSHINEVFHDAQILPFSERDWSEYRLVISVLSEYHRLPHQNEK